MKRLRKSQILRHFPHGNNFCKCVFVLFYNLPIGKTCLHKLWESRDGLFKKLSNIDFKKIIPMI